MTTVHSITGECTFEHILSSSNGFELLIDVHIYVMQPHKRLLMDHQ